MEEMLSWPAGPRETDGIWAKYWYGSVEKETSFRPYQPKPDKVPERLLPVLEECQRCYDILASNRITA
jgi:hypothetical protein